MQIDLFVFDALPEPFYEDVVTPASCAVHADLDAVVFQEPRKLKAGELAPLVGVENVRCASTGDRLLYGFQAEVGGQRIGQPPRQHPPTCPIQDGEQIHDAAPHRDVGDVRCPDLIRTRDLQMAQQIGIDRVGWMPLAGVGLAVERRDAHLLHQRGHMPTSDQATCAREYPAQHPRPCKWVFQVHLVNPAPQRQIRF